MPTISSVVKEVVESEEYSHLADPILIKSARGDNYPVDENELERLRSLTNLSEIPREDFDEIVERAQQRDIKRNVRPRPILDLLETIEIQPEEMTLFEKIIIDPNGNDYVILKKDAEEYLTVGLFPPKSPRLKLGLVYRTTTSPWELVALTQPSKDIHLAAIERDFLLRKIHDFAFNRLNRFIAEHEDVSWVTEFDKSPGIGNTNFPSEILDTTYGDDIIDRLDPDPDVHSTVDPDVDLSM